MTIHYATLWLAALAGALFLAAASLAHAGKLEKRSHQITGPVIVATLIGALGGVGVAAGVHYHAESGHDQLLYFSLSWLTAFLVSVTALMACGLQRERPADLDACGPQPPRSRRWRTVMLFVLAFLFCGLQFAALSSLDAETKRRNSEALAGVASVVSVLAPKAEENRDAAPHYRRAFALLAAAGPVPKWIARVRDAEFDASDPRVPEFLAASTEALAAIRRGAELPECRFGLDYRTLVHAQHYEELYWMREAATLLALQVRADVAANRAPDALRTLAQMERLIAHVLAEPLVIALLAAGGMVEERAQLVSVVIDDLARLDPYAEIPPTRVAPPDTFLNRIPDCLRMEEALLTEGFLALEPMQKLGSRLFLVPFELDALRTGMARLRTRLARPYYELEPLDETALAAELADRGVLGRGCLQALPVVTAMAARADAWRAVERVAWAALRFRAKNGRLPASLADLVPGRFPDAPIDPHDGAPIRVVAESDVLAIYSVGEDGGDDGGAPSTDGGATGDLVIRIR